MSIFADPNNTYGLPNYNLNFDFCNGKKQCGTITPFDEHVNGCFQDKLLRTNGGKNISSDIASITTYDTGATVYNSAQCDPKSNNKTLNANMLYANGTPNPLQKYVANIRSIKADYGLLTDGCALGIYNSAICNKLAMPTEEQKLGAITRICKGDNLNTPLCRDACATYGVCDSAVQQYCKDPANKNAPYCRCINRDPNVPIPYCYDGICMAQGYKTANMRAANSCPPLTLNQCNQYMALGSKLDTVTLQNLQQQCGITATTQIDNNVINSPADLPSNTDMQPPVATPGISGVTLDTPVYTPTADGPAYTPQNPIAIPNMPNPTYGPNQGNIDTTPNATQNYNWVVYIFILTILIAVTIFIMKYKTTAPIAKPINMPVLESNPI